MKTMTRREFLKAGVGLAAAISGIEMMSGCVTTEMHKERIVVYPPLPFNKVQPPQEGCLVGFYKEPESYARLKDSRFKPQSSAEIEAVSRVKNIDEYVETLKKDNVSEKMKIYHIGNDINYIEKALGSKPFLFVLLGPRLYWGFPVTQSTQLVQRSIVPYVRAEIGPLDSPVSIPGFGPKEIAQGRHDSYIKTFAEGAREFGNKYGGFFFNTMQEMNGKWYSWGMNSDFVPAWKHIWQIFEDQGANQYVTWVWVVYCPEGLPAGWADGVELYYPGEKYVDWIGLNTYSIAKNSKADYRLDILIRETYRLLSKDHPEKPIMLSGFGRTNENDQSRWLIDAYGKIKNDFPAIKAATYFDNTWRLTGDHTLNSRSWETLKEISKDPYWVMRK